MRPRIEPTSSWILVGFVNHGATKGTLMSSILEKPCVDLMLCMCTQVCPEIATPSTGCCLLQRLLSALLVSLPALSSPCCPTTPSRLPLSLPCLSLPFLSLPFLHFPAFQATRFGFCSSLCLKCSSGKQSFNLRHKGLKGSRIIISLKAF